MTKRTITERPHSDQFYAVNEPETKPFMNELVALMKKHKLAIVPTYGSSVSFHEQLRVIRLGKNTLGYVKQAGVAFL